MITQKVPTAQRSAAAGSEVSYKLPKDEASRCDLGRLTSTDGLHTDGVLNFTTQPLQSGLLRLHDAAF